MLGGGEGMEKGRAHDEEPRRAAVRARELCNYVQPAVPPGTYRKQARGRIGSHEDIGTYYAFYGSSHRTVKQRGWDGMGWT